MFYSNFPGEDTEQGVVVNGDNQVREGGKYQFAAFANSHGVNTSLMVNFKLAP